MKELYDREPIASRTVEVSPKESWQDTPKVYEGKLRPLFDRCIILRDTSSEVSPGGVLLPNPDKVRSGKVIAVGPGLRDDSGVFRVPDIAVDDNVLLPPYPTGGEIEYQGAQYFIISAQDVLAVL